MPLFLFESTSNETLICFASDPNGANLPANFGPWRRVGSGQSLPVTSNDSDELMQSVMQTGFYMVSKGES